MVKPTNIPYCNNNKKTLLTGFNEKNIRKLGGRLTHSWQLLITLELFKIINNITQNLNYFKGNYENQERKKPCNK